MKILQPWRTRGSSTARWQQQHICNSISKGKWKDQSQLQDEHGEIAKAQNLQTKIDLSPYGHLGSQVRNHLYGVDENLDSITLVGFGSLLTKILFSYRSTEVSGTLIVMKVPTERSRSWGRRASKTATLWKCLKPTASDSLLGSCTRKYSPYGKIKYDTCFEMIDVVPFRDDIWQAPRGGCLTYNYWGEAERLVSKWQMTFLLIWYMTFFSVSNDSHFEMIYDYPFDRATVSLRPQVIKKLLPEPA